VHALDRLAKRYGVAVVQPAELVAEAERWVQARYRLAPAAADTAAQSALASTSLSVIS
jgi:pyruvate-formate lyase